MPVKYLTLYDLGVQGLCFEREIVLKDGSTGIQSVRMPRETFSIRAGEYGLDPVADAETVWDIILNEIHLDGEDESPLLTEDTLEAALEKHLSACLAEKKKLDSRPGPSDWSQEEISNHNDVLQALKDNCPVDQQLALLCREEMKNTIRRIKMAKNVVDPTTPVQKMKRKMVDDIRRREGV